MSWNDEYLTWDPAEYSGISTIQQNMDYIWQPDLYLYNSDIASGMGSCHSMDCIINNSSKVVCIVPCTHVGHCAGDFTKFPFDRQNCTFTFGMRKPQLEIISGNPLKINGKDGMSGKLRRRKAKTAYPLSFLIGIIFRNDKRFSIFLKLQDHG